MKHTREKQNLSARSTGFTDAIFGFATNGYM